MSKRKSAASASKPAAKPGFQPGPSLQPVEPARALDLASSSGGKELWLMQLPLDFEVGESVTWDVSADARDEFRARCRVGGVEYVLCPDADTATMPVYVPPPGQRGAAAKVARRVTVLRTTEAQQLCFGQAIGVDVAATPAKQQRPGGTVAAGEARQHQDGSSKRAKHGEGKEKEKKTKKKEKKSGD